MLSVLPSKSIESFGMGIGEACEKNPLKDARSDDEQ